MGAAIYLFGGAAHALPNHRQKAVGVPQKQRNKDEVALHSTARLAACSLLKKIEPELTAHIDYSTGVVETSSSCVVVLQVQSPQTR